MYKLFVQVKTRFGHFLTLLTPLDKNNCTFHALQCTLAFKINILQHIWAVFTVTESQENTSGQRSNVGRPKQRGLTHRPREYTYPRPFWDNSFNDWSVWLRCGSLIGWQPRHWTSVVHALSFRAERRLWQWSALIHGVVESHFWAFWRTIKATRHERMKVCSHGGWGNSKTAIKRPYLVWIRLYVIVY